MKTMNRSTINLHLGDSLEAMRKMPDNAYDLAIVDPPYGIGATVTIGAGDMRSGVMVESKWEKKQWDNNRPTKEYFKQLKRVSVNQIIWGGNYFSDLLSVSPCWIVWDKVQRIKLPDAEFAWCSFKTGIKIFEYSRSKLQGFMNPNRFHPTEKPVKLYEWLLTNYAKEGNKILDTHLGSCSIAIACHNLKFDLDGWELDEDYYKAGVKRFEQHKKQLQLF
tara:strand:- start:814 stop:1473 length:660 start_codon:yes stop_codon:yes gene_type:complete